LKSKFNKKTKIKIQIFRYIRPIAACNKLVDCEFHLHDLAPR